MSRETAAPIRALIIRADGSWEVSTVAPELEDMQAVVGGPLERVTGRLAAFYLDEEGKRKGQPPNYPATMLAYRLGLGLHPDDVMVGTVLVLGSEVRHGDETGVTDEALHAWQPIADALALNAAQENS